MKRRCPLRQFHRYPPVDSLRVHWVPLVPSSHRRGAFAIRPHPGVRGLPTFRLLCPSRLFVRALAFRWGLPGLLPTRLRIPHEASRVHHVGLKQDSLGGTFLVAPSTLCGSPVPAAGTQGDLCHLLQNRSWVLHRSLLPQTAVSSLTGSHIREGMRGAAFPVGLCVLQVIHRPISQPNATSWRLLFSAWHLLGACCSHHRVVYDA
jgi:hypothetical protein